MTLEQRQNRITAGFFLLSLLLHLLLLFVPKQLLLAPTDPPQPVYVEVRPSQTQDRLLDLPMREELEKPRETTAKRLAEKDQVVKKEAAPAGKDTEDQAKTVRTPKPVRQESSRAPKPQPETPAPSAAKQPAPVPVTPDGWQPKPAETPPKKAFPDLTTLTQISPGTLAQIESDWRRKYHSDVDRGDTVWMDTAQDMLISFMRRFRINIYGVWNYPDEAAQNGQQGTCLVRVTVDRQGNVTNVQLLESSGFRSLDEEAMRAVRDGASYGPLPRSYPHEDLKIMAFFQYYLGVDIRHEQRRRPGDIY